MLDIAIAGGGATGLSLALALRRLSGGALRVGLFDPAAAGSRAGFRASALAAGPRIFLENLGVWAGVENSAAPIKSMRISDSRLEDCVRTTLLQFDVPSDANAPLAHMVFHRDLEAHLADCAKAAGVETFLDCIVSQSVEGSRTVVHTAGGVQFGARLVVGADGGNSQLRS